ncbi:MAG: ATP synthase F0 subunit B, partial [Kiritimatiellae bacterium]|nr:ATP synthase F0 subunit B [Kiritimatiellia bacterium]
KADYDAQMARLAEETQNMMNKAVKEAQAVHDEIVNGAMEQSRIILARAQEHIELEKQKAVKDLRQQVMEISLLVAEKAIGGTINRDLQRRLVDQLFTQVEAKN